VSLDLVVRAAGECLRYSVYAAIGEVLHAAAAGANEVMVMLRRHPQPITRAPILEPDAADEVEVDEQSDGAEDSRPAGAGHKPLDFGDAEEVVAGEDGFDNGAASGGEAVAFRGDK
jgi:hypothetical protein